LAELRFAPKPFDAVMKWAYERFGQCWTEANYGDLTDVAVEVRAYVKVNFSDMKEKQIKELLDAKLWHDQKALLKSGQKLQAALVKQMGAAAVVDGSCDDFNLFEEELKKALKVTGVNLDLREKKQLLDAVSWKNPAAQRVIKKVHKEKANPLYGLFAVAGKVVEFQADGDLRDNENIPLDPSRSVTETVEAYFKKEVAPHVPDAWIDAGKRDEKDGELGIVGYEIAFNKLFFRFEKMKNIDDIDSQISSATKELFNHYRGICKYEKNA